MSNPPILVRLEFGAILFTIPTKFYILIKFLLLDMPVNYANCFTTPEKPVIEGTFLNASYA